jgi:hypothetical protein
MPQATYQTDNSTRLTSLLAEKTDSTAAVPRSRLAERLARLIDLSDSIKLANTLHRIEGKSCAEEFADPSDPLERFRRAHAAMVKVVSGSLATSNSPARVTLGMFVEGDADSGQEDYQPYLKLYAALQRDLEFKVKNLQADIRKILATRSPGMARLVALDTQLGESLARHSRAVFAKTPGILRQQFKHLQQALPDSGDANASNTLYGDLLQQTLLAEIEARLLPVLGLLEALDDTTED